MPSPSPPASRPSCRGAEAVARETALLRQRAAVAVVSLVDGAPGILVAPGGRLEAVLRVDLTEQDHVRAYDVIGDPATLADIDIRLLDQP